MHKESPAQSRDFKQVRIKCDLAVVGGGMAGICCAIAAARAGIKVALLQDRPVLGGNASSEIRLLILGASAQYHNNNRWAREGGVIDEILLENTYRNPEGNPVLVDSILLEKIITESNISLYLNTTVFEVAKSTSDTIESIKAYNNQNSTMYEIRAPLFCDASGDGVVGFLAGAAFRMGAEDREEFDEGLAPDTEYGELLGHSLYFYSKDFGRPVKFIPPSYALDDITKIPRFRRFNTREHGVQLWWLEYGGRLDSVHDTEEIKWELWKIVYGVWNYIKNSGNFPEAETLTLEWVGLIPGKRESRRFEGPYILSQKDIIEQRQHYDVVSYGGWPIDLHPADGIYSEEPACVQWHARGVYQIPYRCLYSRNISNLFLAGRIISCSHVAHASSRVMATCANSAQAVGIAAAMCTQKNLQPAGLNDPKHICELQNELMHYGQFIPGMKYEQSQDLAQIATITASSQLLLSELKPGGPLLPLAQPIKGFSRKPGARPEDPVLSNSWAQILPLDAGPVPKVTFLIDVSEPTTLRMELRIGKNPEDFTPDILLDSKALALETGQTQEIQADFNITLDQPRYVYYCLITNDAIAVHTSEQRVTGILSANHQKTQTPETDIGIETFELWCPARRPEGQNLAIKIEPPLDVFKPANVINGLSRPTKCPNAWVADIDDKQPTLTLRWDQPKLISCIELAFDTDFDHPLESVMVEHPERAMPYCVKHYRVLGQSGETILEEKNNHQTWNRHVLSQPITTNHLDIQMIECHGTVPPALFEIRVFSCNPEGLASEAKEK
jgi:hypothetical protein